MHSIKVPFTVPNLNATATAATEFDLMIQLRTIDGVAAL